MDEFGRRHGRRDRSAPEALERFAFLVGDFRCDARILMPDGAWQDFKAVWRGRFILGGRAIADEYRMTDAAGSTIVHGLNLRVYDAAAQRWNIKWLDVLAGTWLDLGPEALGGVRYDGPSIVYAFREPMAGHAFTRATYEHISDRHFTWRGERSDDGTAWTDFMVIEADRVDGDGAR